MRRRFTNMDDRLSAYINKTDSCWNWTGDMFTSGYGRLSIGKGNQVRAHRFLYEQKYGVIPDGLFALHKCDNRKCVNPDHIFIGTKKDNAQDMLKKGRNRYKTLKGIDSPNTKLTATDIADIRRLYATGRYYQRELGKKFHTSQVAISRIVLGITYK